MTKLLEQEFKALISIALSNCEKAIEENDLETAEIFRQEAFDLLEQFPENQVYMRILQ